MDPSSPLSLASVPVLLVPIGTVRTSTWAHWSAVVSSFTSIHQSDIPLDGNLRRSRFFPSLSLAPSTSTTVVSPKANSSNDVHLAYTHTLPPQSSRPSATSLSLFRPTTQILAVVGIVDLGDGCTTGGLAMAKRLMACKLDELFPSAEGYPLVARCFGVEQGEQQETLTEVEIDGGEGPSVRAGREEAEVAVIPSSQAGGGDPKLIIGALLGDMVGALLAELADIATILESPSGLALLQQSTLPPFSILPRTSPPTPSGASSSRTSLSLSNYNNNVSLPSLPGQTPTSISRTSSPLQQPHRADTLPNAPTPSSLGNGTPQGTPPPFARSVSTTSFGGNSPRTGSPGLETGPAKTSFGGPARKRIVSASPSMGMSSPSPLASSSTNGVTVGGAGPARLASLMGGMHLLSGRLADAVLSFNEALTLFNKLPAYTEPIWHASTIEGLSTTLVLLASRSLLPVQTPPSPLSFHETINTQLTLALSLYHRAIPPLPQPTSVSTRDPLPALYTWCALRHARILSALYHSPAEISSMTLKLPPPPPPSSGSSSSSSAFARRGGPPPAVSKGDVGRQTSRVHGPWLVALEGRERLVVLGHLSSLMRGLGMKRREGMYARERLACLVDLLVDARMRSAAPVEEPGSEVAVRVGDGKDGNEAVLRVLRGVLEGLGVDLEEDEGVWLNEGDSGTKKMDLGRTAEEGGREKFGWPELQMRAMRDAIGIAEVLPDHSSVVVFSLTALRTLHPYISPGEQAHLAALFPRALATARRRGELIGDGRLRFWAGWLVLSLQVGLLPPTHVPIEHGIQDRAIAQSLTATGLVRDPFLYNPRSKFASLSKSVVVQNETLEFLITLQNPFSFDLEIQDVRLSTTGVPFTSHPCPVVLLPNAFQTIRVTGFASTPGTLVVQGCFVRLPDGSEAEFLLPVHDAAEEKRQRKRESMIVEMDRAMKLVGLNARPSERRKRESQILEEGAAVVNGVDKTAQKAGGKPKSGVPEEPGFLSCEVVPEQPLVRIRGTSLTHGAIMLYDGEETNIRITLENTSTLPVDFVKLSFQDSTTARLQAIISEGELTAGEAYELESDLIHRPVFRWEQPEAALVIPPGGKKTINVWCRGKVGCVHGSIIINYAYLDRPGQDRPTLFHTRQITFPILISVYPTLECSSLDILRLPVASRALATPSGSSSGNEAPLEDEDHCLFAIDVRNVYGQPFEVTFERTAGEGEEKPLSASRLIPPGATERIVLPLTRLLLPSSQTCAPIPTLAERQFIVSRSTASKSEEALTRSLFWYREQLLGSVQASWKEPGTARRGHLSLRSQRLTEPMLDVLRADEVVISLSIPSSTSTPPVVESNAFFDVHVRIKNRLSRPLYPLIHLSPLSLTPNHTTWASPPSRGPTSSQPNNDPASTHFIHDGQLSKMLPQRRLESGEEGELRFKVGVMARGTVGVRVGVEDLGGVGTRRMRGARGQGVKEEGPEAGGGGQVWFGEVLEVSVQAEGD